MGRGKLLLVQGRGQGSLLPACLGPAAGYGRPENSGYRHRADGPPGEATATAPPQPPPPPPPHLTLGEQRKKSVRVAMHDLGA